MESVFSQLAERLERFRELLGLDYAAVARVDERDNQIRYVCVTGNTTRRHVHIVRRPGSGLVGHVVRCGRPAVIDQSREDLPEMKKRYPIMLAEKLEAVMAVPIFDGEIVTGALLGGVRRSKAYSDNEVDQAERHAAGMAELLKWSAFQS